MAQYHLYSKRELEAYATVDKFAEIALRNGMQYRERTDNTMSVILYEGATICFNWRSEFDTDKVGQGGDSSGS